VVKVVSVLPGSPAERAGIVPGDGILEVEGHGIRDEIDLRFWASDDRFLLTLERDGRRFRVEVRRGPDEGLGIELEPIRPRTCRNRCIFCFVDQLPRGLRRSLYVKDEDYRLSFLYGNYITLTDLSDEDFERIFAQRLSPLYVSVHSTDPEVRSFMLGRKGIPDIRGQLKRLVEGGIRVHAQVVLCPGINDGGHLDGTLRDLARMHPGVASVAVVPVGLTEHRQGLYPLRPVGPEEAERTLEQIADWQGRFLRELGTRFAFASDEFYILAGKEFPAEEDYEGFPQLEDGVGMARRFLETFGRRSKELPGRVPPLSIALVTGTAFGPIMEKLARKVESRVEGLSLRPVVVENRLLGKSVTVSGLLSGGDILRALEESGPGDCVLLPPNCVNDDGLLLDDLRPEDLALRLGVPVRVGSYDLVGAITEAVLAKGS